MVQFIKTVSIALLLGALVASCGGGVGSGGTGAPAGYAAGTVTGFGSVIVDGARFDDSNASVQVERGPGETVNSAARLGQQVEIDFEADGVAKAVRIEAEAIGPIGTVGPPDTLTILGQTVKVNTDANAGPVTVLAGYDSPADAKPGDVVEVHGLLRRDAASGALAVQATRIEFHAAAPSYLRVTGVVSGLDPGAHVFKLGGLSVDATTASVVPAGAALANGQAVVVFGKSVLLDASGAPTLAAQMVRIRQRANVGVAAYLGGVVSSLDATRASFELDGVRVTYAGATIVPPQRTLADGVYAQVRGNFSSGVLAATQIKIRNKQDEAPAQLRGTVLRYAAATQRFQVRDVLVDASGATQLSCPASGLADGFFVEIEGSVTSFGVQAAKVTCESEPADAVVTRTGIGGAVDTTGKTFTLMPLGAPALTVRWTAQTYFDGSLTPQTLSGRSLQVQGVFTAGVLVASKIEPDS